MQVVIEKIRSGLIFDQTTGIYPSRLYAHCGQPTHFNEISSYYFGFVAQGEVEIHSGTFDRPMPLQAGMYFGLSGKVEIRGGGKVVVIERLGYRGLNTFGGPVEEHGRLLYIDYCRSSILVPPQRLGEPVLNLLTFPPGVLQTMHVHPTVRFGLVFSGRGKSITPTGSLHLEPGTVFHISEGAPHCFETTSEPMTVIAFHPDSDWGPTDASHPMLNRTYRKI